MIEIGDKFNKKFDIRMESSQLKQKIELQDKKNCRIQSFSKNGYEDLKFERLRMIKIDEKCFGEDIKLAFARESRIYYFLLENHLSKEEIPNEKLHSITKILQKDFNEFSFPSKIILEERDNQIKIFRIFSLEKGNLAEYLNQIEINNEKIPNIIFKHLFLQLFSIIENTNKNGYGITELRPEKIFIDDKNHLILPIDIKNKILESKSEISCPIQIIEEFFEYCNMKFSHIFSLDFSFVRENMEEALSFLNQKIWDEFICKAEQSVLESRMELIIESITAEETIKDHFLISDLLVLQWKRCENLWKNMIKRQENLEPINHYKIGMLRYKFGKWIRIMGNKAKEKIEYSTALIHLKNHFKSNSSLELAAVYDALGCSYYYDGIHEKAKLNFDKSFANIKDIIGEKGNLNAAITLNQAHLYYDIDKNKAEELIKISFQVIKETSDEDDLLIPIIYSNLSSMFHQTDKEKAKFYFQKAIGLKRRLWGDLHPTLFSTYERNLEFTLEMYPDKFKDKKDFLYEKYRCYENYYGEDHYEVKSICYWILGYFINKTHRQIELLSFLGSQREKFRKWKVPVEEWYKGVIQTKHSSTLNSLEAFKAALSKIKIIPGSEISFLGSDGINLEILKVESRHASTNKDYTIREI